MAAIPLVKNVVRQILSHILLMLNVTKVLGKKDQKSMLIHESKLTLEILERVVGGGLSQAPQSHVPTALRLK